jgi:hypothetical protein
MARNGAVAALAGRRIDLAQATRCQFPLQNISRVRALIERELLGHDVQLLVCSAACGADLLALDCAFDLRVSARIILPYDPARFRETSVVDRPGEWGTLFDRAIEDAARNGQLIVLELREAEHPFMAVNHRIIHDALTAARGGNVLAIAVWEGKSGGAEDVTADFVERARAAGCTQRNIPTC